MQYGHFDDARREYVITTPRTPLPWINYLGSEDFFTPILFSLLLDTKRLLHNKTIHGISFFLCFEYIASKKEKLLILLSVKSKTFNEGKALKLSVTNSNILFLFKSKYFKFIKFPCFSKNGLRFI